VIVIRQPSGSYKSTPFQVAFSSNLLKNITKKNEVQLFVNDERVEIPLRLDIQNGRITFIKVLVLL
jgi:phosphatidate phosphatase PAH1